MGFIERKLPWDLSKENYHGIYPMAINILKILS